jgi:hypothetical protein
MRAIPAEHRKVYYDALLAGRAEADRLGCGLLDDRIFAAFHRALYRPTVKLIEADTQRKVAKEIEAKGSPLCDCDSSDGEPTNIRTGEPMDHHCDCAAVRAVEAAFPGQRTRHQDQCPPCGNRAIARGGDSGTVAQ